MTVNYLQVAPVTTTKPTRLPVESSRQINGGLNVSNAQNARNLPFLIKKLTQKGSISATSSNRQFPPADYATPRWPSLFWPPLEDRYVLYYLGDMWRFTLIWTFVMYACFHWAAVGIALTVQIGKRGKTKWIYLWTVPIVYSAIAAVEALVAGSVTGAMSVSIYVVLPP